MAAVIKDCLFCGKLCKSPFQLEAHLRRHHIFERAFFCKQCPHSYFSNEGLTAHNKSHSNSKPFACGSCPLKFKTPWDLRRHIKGVHQKLKPFKCELCSKSFLVNYKLTDHMLIHTGEKPHSCGVCNKGFNQTNNLRRHMKMHFSTDIFSCHVCGRVFAAKVGLQRHLKIHNGDKKFECNFCSYKCVSSSELTRHMLTHTRERHHHCKKCCKEFSSRSNKINHDRAFHTDGTGKLLEAPSICVFCDKEFQGCRKKRELEGHLLAHICERPEMCPNCMAEFTYRNSLLRHHRKHHKKNI